MQDQQQSNTNNAASEFTISSLPESLEISYRIKDLKVDTVVPCLRSRLAANCEDSQLSTSSNTSNTSSRNGSLGRRTDSRDNSLIFSEDTKYPTLFQSKTGKSRASSQTFKDLEMMDSPVAEEGEEQEVENQFLKKLPVIADAEEFNTKKNHTNRFRTKEIFSADLSRCRSMETSFLPLDSVQEDKNEEEQTMLKQNRKLRLQILKMEDLNEFNKNSLSDRSMGDKRNRRTPSMQLQPEKEVIIEEQENHVVPHLHSVFGTHSGSGSHRGSILGNSPGAKLKVDEIDFWVKKLEAKEEDIDEDDIDPIIEENEEKNGQVEETKEYQVAKAKMNEEREFMKKVIKGDMIDGSDQVLTKFGAERDFGFHAGSLSEVIIEEDNNENMGN